MRTGSSQRPGFLLAFARFNAIVWFVPFLINTGDILIHPFARTMADSSASMRLLMGLLAAPLTFAIAVLCIRRAPTNLIGWLLVAFSYGMSVQVMRVDLLPLDWALVVRNYVIGLFWQAYILIPLYFPDGQLYPASMNRWINPLIGANIVFSTIITAICDPEHAWGDKGQFVAANPLFLFEWDFTVVTRPVGIAMLAAGVVMMVLRYRGSRALGRLQMRWLFVGVLFQAALTVLLFQKSPALEPFAGLITSTYAFVTPTTIGIAVLRYRLYDIDLIIRRTLQYGLLSVLLGLLYYGLVVVLGQLVQGLTGQQSPLVVVVSTLVIAAIFTPLRRRIQQIIDRRFFRQQYDSEQTLQAFSASARQETDLNRLSGSLVKAVQQSIQPESVLLWLPKVEHGMEHGLAGFPGSYAPRRNQFDDARRREQ